MRALVLLALLVAPAARASEELELIRLALWANSGPAASGRPLDHRPLVGRETVAPSSVVQRFTETVIGKALAGAPAYATETARRFAEQSSAPISIRELPSARAAIMPM